VFGSSDKWTGLGVFFDSFDNDNKHNNPYISAVVNDGTKAFDHQQDGSTQLLAGCLRDFRNKPFPTRAKVEYYMNTLTVLFHGGMTNNDQDYEMCLRAENVFLPKNGYFGLSAATGGLADDHDVFHFLTTSLHPPGEIGSPGGHQLPVEDSQKLTQEYADYQSKLEKQKEEYRREHPEEKKPDDLENWFESDNQRELRQIWQAQSTTNEVLRDMTRKLDEIIGRQERTLGLLSAGGAVAPQPHGGAGAGGPTSTIMRHEVDSLMGQQNLLVQTVKDIRGLVGDVHSRTDTILTNQGRGQGSAHVQPAGYDVQSVIAEMRDGMNQVKQGVAAVGQRLAQQVPPAAAQTGCPTKNCLGMTPFLITITIQLVIILGYSIYR
jgi:lectin, mannose-binding 1